MFRNILPKSDVSAEQNSRKLTAVYVGRIGNRGEHVTTSEPINKITMLGTWTLHRNGNTVGELQAAR